MIDAPALNASRAACAISTMVTGTGCCLGLVSTPVRAQVKATFSVIGNGLSRLFGGGGGDLYEQLGLVDLVADLEFDLGDLPGGRGGDDRLDLHGFEGQQRRADFDVLPKRDGDRQHSTHGWRADAPVGAVGAP